MPLQTAEPGFATYISMKAPLAILVSLTTFATAMEVHEWGTFTVLSGSNGYQVPWYASYGDLARLPDFVSPGIGIGGKAGFARIRMETPVLYFYPEKQQKVSVDVSFTGGSITETFPHSVGGKVGVNPGMSISMDGHWSGTLLPPTDKEAIAGIPSIVKNDHLEPYGAAREVPDAWIFQSDVKEIPGLKDQPKFPQQEKFIFYRGAGAAEIPILASMTGDVATVTNQCKGAIPFGVALRVRDGKAAWVTIPAIAAAPSGDEPAMNRAQVAFPDPGLSLDEAESQLAGVWKKALEADGLTTAEASAMVETWRTTWFRENGDRILSLVPRKTVDAMLPLTITPAPEKTERVFVARIEILCPEREGGLADLMSSTKAVDGTDFKTFSSLGLGRFANGAKEIATQVQISRMNAKFYELIRFGQNAETTAR